MMDVMHLTAANVMTQPVTCASPDDRLGDLEQKLFDDHVGGMPVVENGQLVGVISRSEFVRVPLLMADWNAYARDELQRDGPAMPGPVSETTDKSAAGDVLVRHVMPSQVVTCSPETPLSEVAGEMVSHHVHRIVVTEDNRPVGIISSLDLVKLLQD